MSSERLQGSVELDSACRALTLLCRRICVNVEMLVVLCANIQLAEGKGFKCRRFCKMPVMRDLSATNRRRRSIVWDHFKRIPCADKSIRGA
ncbi:uncharacterized protein LOC120286842 isoform X2 [Eucalyptus grandis]|uniref:uncharacterized protein LOC120286842 isoform X2 n=1 Tax=Eucalyptus grandis TaxID=71139 RepID=UPI00052579A9|nr:uncharacterized protein LOC120286842 isoform X2 [Eucalyptus grandis]